MSVQLMQHQTKGVEIARSRPRFAYLHDCGLGKTIMVLAIIRDAKSRGFTGKTLVIAPKTIMRCAWEGDAKHFPDLCLRIVWSSKPAERRGMIAKSDGIDILVTNPETFKKHAADFLAAGVTRLVIDESSKIKTHNSQISKACHLFADKMQSVYILSGTPAPNDRTEYWSQMRCVDRSIFGDSFYRFAATFFVPIKRTISGTERIIGWAPARSREADFFTKLQSASWSLTKEEAIDLPEQIDVTRGVELSDAEFDAYRTMLAECRAEFADGRSMNATLQSRMMKLRQITGGAILSGGNVETIGTAKLDELESVMEEIGERPIVIWAEFTNEIDRIVQRVRHLGRSVEIIDGRIHGDVRAGYVAAFQDGRISTLVCQPAAAGHGITLTAASYAIYYSHGYSFENYKQSRDRIHRTGQHKPCVYYHLIANRTIDERVLKALGTKRDAHDEVMELLGEEQREMQTV